MKILTVDIGTGGAMVNAWPDGHVAILDTATTTGTIAAPTVNPRIDLVQIDENGSVEVKTGTEAASPSAPSVDADAVSLATIELSVGGTEIANADITDTRTIT